MCGQKKVPSHVFNITYYNDRKGRRTNTIKHTLLQEESDGVERAKREGGI